MPPENHKYPLRLYNTLSQKLETFTSRRSDEIKMFTCGPSLYDIAHIGNYRTFLYEDILQRYLQFLGYRVTRLINFTDVEDKSIEQANSRATTISELTEKPADNFYRSAGLLHIKLPDYIPRSSTSVDQAVFLITKLLQKGYAYRYKESIFYDPLKFDGFGKLFGLDLGSWPSRKRRFWKDTYPGNRWNLGDFILWHGYRKNHDGSIFWKTPLGKGRPAWNIQDPAMISKHLGFEIDISCGGVDNLFRHHDYTIAVMEAVSGKPFSRFWLHGEHVLLDGRKMSKSTGNILYPSTLFKQGFSGAGLRFYLINKHYRRKLNLTQKSLEAGDSRCKKLRNMAAELINPLTVGPARSTVVDRYIDRLTEDFSRHMSDDLQVGRACRSVENNLHYLLQLKNRNSFDPNQQLRIRTSLLGIDGVLQVLFP